MDQLLPKISNAELEIMQVIWTAGQPLNYTQIRQSVGHNARQTIQTLITRLVAKGILIQEKREVYYYRPTITRQEYAEIKTIELMDKVYLGSAKDLVAALFRANAFSARDVEELKQFWQEVKEDEQRV